MADSPKETSLVRQAGANGTGTRKVFCYIKQTVSLNKTLCFIIENTLFPLTKQFVPLYENKLFFVVETKCFSMLEQAVQCCELTD